MSQVVPAYLEIEDVDPESKRQFIPILRPSIRLGREEDNDIVTADTLSSRYHAQLRRQKQQYVVADLGSTNGVWVNGKRIQVEQALADGDQILIGRIPFRFYVGGTDAEKIGRFLHAIPLFSRLNTESRRDLIADARIQVFRRGVVIPAAQLADALYVVLCGRMAAVTSPPDARDRADYGPGQFLDGARAVRNRAVRSVEMLQNTWLLLLNRERLDEQLVAPFLQRLGLDALTPEQIRTIAQHLHMASHRPGDRLFDEGQDADALYCVVHGRVAMMKQVEGQPQPRQTVFRHYEDAALFGERELLANRPRAASAEVRTDATLLVLPGAQFQTLRTHDLQLALGLYHYLVNHLAEQSSDF